MYRSDGSGTNFLFSDYLSKSNAKFKSSIGANTSVQWPAGIGAKGNEGVANMTTQTDGAIGYVEYAYAKQNKMAYTLLTNKAAPSWRPIAKSFQAAAANADWVHADSYYLISDRSAGRQELADHRRQLHSGVQAAERRGLRQRGIEVLCLGVQGWRYYGSRAGLRAVARAVDCPGEEDLDLGNHLGGPSGVERK